MERKRIIHMFLLVVLILIFSSCHRRHVSDIKPNLTKEEVVSLWGKTDLITHRTEDGKTVETWEYHFSNTDSICSVTFSQDRVVSTECHNTPRERYYYAYPYYPYYYPYDYPYPYPYYYPHPYPYYYRYHYPHHRHWR